MSSGIKTMGTARPDGIMEKRPAGGVVICLPARRKNIATATTMTLIVIMIVAGMSRRCRREPYQCRSRFQYLVNPGFGQQSCFRPTNQMVQKISDWDTLFSLGIFAKS
jgi:hypothetical protein